MKTQTITDVCNRALGLIGEEPITSIDDNSTLAARVCKANWDIAFNSLLAEGEWNFTLTDERLVRIAYKSPYEYQKGVFAIPEKCAYIARVYRKREEKHMPGSLDWDIKYIPELADKYIVCNVCELPNPEDLPVDEETGDILPVPEEYQIWIEYLKDIGNMSLFSATFLDCLAANLAVKICMPITKDMQKMQALLEYYQLLLRNALQQNLNQDGEDKMMWKDPITASRG